MSPLRAPSRASPTGDAGVTWVRPESAIRRPTSSYSTSRPRVVSHAHDGTQSHGTVAGDRAVDDRRGGDDTLELRDLDPIDGRIIENREPVVVVTGAPEVARVAQPRGEVCAVRAAKRLQFSHRLIEVVRAEHHAAGGWRAARRERIAGVMS